MKKSAAARTGYLFDPGPQSAEEHPIEDSYTDGTKLRVVRWKLLSERPCIVRTDHGERTIQMIRGLTTLCGRVCTDAQSSTAKAPADEGFCNTCLSRAGRGVLR